MKNLEELINFWLLLGNLKQIPRTGWLVRGVNIPETVAAHNWRVGVIAYFLGSHFEIDMEKLFAMALFHELGEVKLGDVPTPMGEFFSKDEVEWEVVKKLGKDFKLDEKILTLMDEYYHQNTLEKRLVVAADKIDMFLQALFYFEAGNKKVEDFFAKIDKYIEEYQELSLVVDIFKLLKQKYEEKRS